MFDPSGKWTPNPAVLVQPATHQAPHQICPALQGEEWKTDGGAESWEIEVGQDVLKGDKQTLNSGVRTLLLSSVDPWREIISWRSFQWGLLALDYQPRANSSEDTAGNKQIIFQSTMATTFLTVHFLLQFLQTVQLLVVWGDFRFSDGLWKEAGLIPACTSLTWNTQLALRWIYVFFPPVWLTILFPLQCLLCHDFI